MSNEIQNYQNTREMFTKRKEYITIQFKLQYSLSIPKVYFNG